MAGTLHHGIYYSDKFFDGRYEYRQVILPDETAKKINRNTLLSEDEWRALGVQQSKGWVHYDYHKPNPNVLLFRRPLLESQK